MSPTPCHGDVSFVPTTFFLQYLYMRKQQTSKSARTFPALIHAECSGIAKTHVLFRHLYMRKQQTSKSARTFPALIHAECSIRANPHVHFLHPYMRNAAGLLRRTYSSSTHTRGIQHTRKSARTFPASVHAECSGIAKTHVLFQHSYTRNTAYAQIRTYISCIRTCGMQRDCQDACTLPALIHAECSK